MEDKKREFKGVWIPKEIWLDTRLNALDKMIFAEIDSYSSTENGCYASNEYLANFCQCSESKASKTISKLIELGYIERKSFDGRNRVLQSCLVNFTMHKCKKCYPAEQNLQDIKIDYKHNRLNTNTPYNPPVGESRESVVQCNEEFEEQSKKPKRKQKASNDEITEKAQSVIAYLNEKTRQRFNTKTKGNLSKAVARLKEGYTVDDLKAVIDFKVAAWMGTDMQQYLRPETLFAPTKFDGYLNAARMGFNSKPTNYSNGYQKPQYESISAKHKREEEETRRKIKSGEYIPAPWEDGYEE